MGLTFRRLLLFVCLVLLPLLRCAGAGTESPFSPRASLLRQWKRLFASEQMPSILLSKASPLNASQVAAFSRYISDGSLPAHLSAFCSAANLFCDLKRPANVTSDVKGDADFQSYSNKDFRRYQKDAVFGSDNFKNYSVEEGVARDSFLRYGEDGTVSADFASYAFRTNAGGSGFSGYDKNSNGGSGSFLSYGQRSNNQGHDFAAYAAESSAVSEVFTSYSESSNVVKNGFNTYAKDANAFSGDFTGYSTDSNVGTNSFKAYGAAGNGAGGTFKSYGVRGNTVRSDFRSYDEDGNGGSKIFETYGEEAANSDNNFRSYGKGNNGPFQFFSNYGKTFGKFRSEFVEYDKNAAADIGPQFVTYVGDNSSFKEYFGSPGIFTFYVNSSEAAASTAARVEPGKFFRRANLAEGKFIPMPDIRDKMPPRSFLPRLLADGLPFESARLPELVRLLGAQGLQGVMAKTLADCERPPVKDETKRCPTSLEAMAEFAVSVLGKSAAVSTTESTAGWGKTLVVGKVAPRRGAKETAAVSCHQSLFPYLVYYCHAVPRVAVYDVELKEKAGGETVNRGVAICHLDTSQWSAGHAAFLALGPAPGKIEVCHWIFEHDLIWVAREG